MLLLSFFPLSVDSFLFLEAKLMKCQSGRTFSSAEGKKLILLKHIRSLFPNASSICTLC